MFLPDNADIENAVFNIDDNKSSGDELGSREDVCSRSGSKEDVCSRSGSKEDICSRSGTDDAAERGSDSTRDELSESDVDAGTAAMPKDVDKETYAAIITELKGREKEVEVAAVPVPMPRRRKGLSSTSVNKADEGKSVETARQKKIAPKRPNVLPARYNQKGTTGRAWLRIVDLAMSW